MTTVASTSAAAAGPGTPPAETARIVVLPGDGIGPEIMDAGLRVLAVAEPAATEPPAAGGDFPYAIESRPFGGDAIDRVGSPLPDATLAACREADAVLLAAIGGPRWDDAPVRPESGLLRLHS